MVSGGLQESQQPKKRNIERFDIGVRYNESDDHNKVEPVPTIAKVAVVGSKEPEGKYFEAHFHNVEK